MNLATKIRDNFKLDFYLFTADNLNLFEKVTLWLKKYISIILGRRYISYFGNDFFYDSKFTPALIVSYPKEISLLDKYVNFNSIMTILDAGANIGQFSYTLKKLFPHLHIYSFEPNKEIFPLLKKNSKYFSDWHIYNFGLDEKTTTRDF